MDDIKPDKLAEIRRKESDKPVALCILAVFAMVAVVLGYAVRSARHHLEGEQLERDVRNMMATGEAGPGKNTHVTVKIEEPAR